MLYQAEPRAEVCLKALFLVPLGVYVNVLEIYSIIIQCGPMEPEKMQKINKALRVMTILFSVALAACLAYAVRLILMPPR